MNKIYQNVPYKTKQLLLKSLYSHTFMNAYLLIHVTSLMRCVYFVIYSIKTLDHSGQEEYFPCASREEVKAVLKCKVSKQEMREREVESPIKEITLGMPADILKVNLLKENQKKKIRFV